MSDKPLPSMPTNEGVAMTAADHRSVTATAVNRPTRLTIEARAHRRLFIRRLLAEESIVGADEWLATFEAALDELGGCIANSGWITDVRRSRTVSRAERESKVAEWSKEKSEKDKETKERRKKDKEAGKEKEDRDKTGVKGILIDGHDEKGSAEHDEDVVRVALAQIQQRIHAPATPPVNGFRKHFLLTLAPMGSFAPPHDMDSDVIPSLRSCIFTSGVFQVPSFEEWRQKVGASILCGLEEWDAQYDASAENQTFLVGGNFALRGVDNVAQFNILSRILCLSVFFHLSLLLEQHFLADSQVTLRFPPPAAPRLAFSYSSPAETASTPESKSTANKGTTPGLWSFIARRTEDLYHRALHGNKKHQQGSLPLPATVANSAPVKRSGSLDLASLLPSARRHSGERFLPASKQGRRRSFSGSGATSSRPSMHTPSESASGSNKSQPNHPRFEAILDHLSESRTLLSTSTGVSYPPPKLIHLLAQKEGRDPQRKLLAEEKIALGSLLGWEGKDAYTAMVGAQGFIRHQGITCLYAEYIYKRGESSLKASSQTTSKSDSQAVTPRGSRTPTPPPREHLPCGSARWVTYRYYSRKGKAPEMDDPTVNCGDLSLGDYVQYLCQPRCKGVSSKGTSDDSETRTSADVCSVSGCGQRRHEHERFWLHGTLRVAARISTIATLSVEKSVERQLRLASLDGERLEEEERKVHMWLSCAICMKETSTVEMADGTYLLSFGKFLELLLYSPNLYTLSQALCEHTAPSQNPWPPTHGPPDCRFNLRRHFCCGGSVVTLSLESAPIVFDLKISELQVLRHNDGAKAEPMKMRSNSTDSGGERDKGVLRREMKVWWQGIAEHLDKLEDLYAATESDGSAPHSRRSLPRLPSVDDQYDDGYASEGTVTPIRRESPLPPTPASGSDKLLLAPPAEDVVFPRALNSPGIIPSSSDETAFSGAHSTSRLPSVSSVDTVTESEQSKATEGSGESFQLLLNLRHSFQKAEQSLYALLSRTPASNLNDVRRSFASIARGAAMRLAAWQRKHPLPLGILPAELSDGRKSKASQEKLRGMMQLNATEPEWWRKGCHAVPGGNIVVREEEWGSIISFTLSSIDYHRELSGMYSNKPSQAPSRSTTMASTPSTSSPATEASTGQNSTSGSRKKEEQLDPDDDTDLWYDIEPCSTNIARHEQPRDYTGLLSLKDVLRHRGNMDIPASLILAPLKLVQPAQQSAKTGTPASAWAQPAVQVSMQAADGTVSGLPEAADTVEKLLHDMDSSSSEHNKAASGSLAGSFSTISGFVETHIKRGHANSLISTHSPEGSDGLPQTVTVPAHPAVDSKPLPPIEDSPSAPSMGSPCPSYENGPTSATPSGSGQHLREKTLVAPPPPEKLPSNSSASPTTTTFTTSIMSTFSNAVRSMLVPAEPSRPMSPSHHHKLLATLETTPVDDKPHIKYEWTLGKRMKFSCTVYYAKEFDLLRKRCGIKDTFVRSLERSEMWSAEGGKSRSNFWKTSDDRFVIKSLVNAWNVADLQVLLDITPSYIRYLEGTATRPSLLAKVMGFYTVEIKNIETGAVQAKADLLVMENLFYGRNITKTFDLKGIQGRKVKASGEPNRRRTLFDGDWIEGQQKAIVLIQPDAKHVLHEAIKADAEFLSRSNIMDYSLLLGIDEQNHQIACGLVDTIGSYTFAKTLEYKAKHNLISGREITVIPPNEYHDRFVTAMNNYFLASPDKWTKSPCDPHHVQDFKLPSVL